MEVTWINWTHLGCSSISLLAASRAIPGCGWSGNQHFTLAWRIASIQQQGGICGGVKESQQAPATLQPLSTPTTCTTAATPTTPHTPHRSSIFSHLRFASLSCGVVIALRSFPSHCCVGPTRAEHMLLFASGLMRVSANFHVQQLEPACTRVFRPNLELLSSFVRQEATSRTACISFVDFFYTFCR